MNCAPAAAGKPVNCKKLSAWFAKYALAICCIVAPLVFGFLAPNYVANFLMPDVAADQVGGGSSGITTLPVPAIEYFFRDRNEISRPPQGAFAANQQKEHDEIQDSRKKVRQLLADENTSDVTVARTRVSEIQATQIKRIEQDSRYLADTLAGRYAYVAASSLLYAIVFAIIVFAGWIVLPQDKNVKEWLQSVALSLGIVWIACFLVMIILFRSWPSAYVTNGHMILSMLTSAAANSIPTELLKRLPVDTGNRMNTLILVNTVAALVAVGGATLAFAVLATRSNEKNPKKLHMKLLSRFSRMKGLIILCSVMLVIATLASKSVYEWPLKLLVAEQVVALTPLANALTMHLGVMGTIALFSAARPAIAAYSLDVAELRSSPGTTVEGLDFNLSTIATTIVAVAAPALTTPVVEGLKAAFGAWS